MEYRAVSSQVPGTFKCFETKDEAIRFMTNGGSLLNDTVGPYRLESRPAGGTKEDWREMPAEDVELTPESLSSINDVGEPKTMRGDPGFQEQL